jgi:molybdate transport system substrate-binding protein
MTLRRGRAALAAAALLTLLVGCAAQTDADARHTGTPGATPVAELSGTLTVFAAASLTETFDALAEEFERQHPSVEVVVNYGGSAALAQQIVSGAPADVFAAASEATMQTVVDEGRAADPVAFATNTLELVVPAGNPGAVTGLPDLARPELAIALCDPVVPCGAAAEKLLAAVGVAPAPDTLEADVKAVVTKVRLGEADAGLVYVTDVRAAGGDVEGIAIPEAATAVNVYPVSPIAGSSSPEAAVAWIAMLTGPEGRRVLTEAGFGEP